MSKHSEKKYLNHRVLIIYTTDRYVYRSHVYKERTCEGKTNYNPTISQNINLKDQLTCHINIATTKIIQT